jgi:hypothetical protein
VNEWDDDNLDDEGPLDSDLDELDYDDEPPTEPGPACGADIYDDSPQCPVCGEYIFPGSGSTHRWPLWLVVVAAVALVAFICYILL